MPRRELTTVNDHRW